MRWHRGIGAGLAAVVLFITVTGIVLNHGAGLGLDQRKTAAPWILALYGRAPDAAMRGFRVGGGWIVWVDGKLLLDGRMAGEGLAEIVGAVRAGDFVVAAAPEEMLLLTLDGALVERLSGAALPGRIERIGTAGGGGVVVQTPRGRFAASGELAGWQPSAVTADWATPSPPPEALRQAALDAYRGAGVPWSRVLLDVHSGRILGAWGPYAVDAIGLGLLFLAGSGFWYWLRSRR